MSHLDGIRGAAVILVLLHHSPAGHYFPFGGAGVDLFFVLSGFLITRILLESRRAPGYFLNFYARRALRIWPLYYVLVVFVFGALPFLLPDTYPVDVRWLPSYLLYLQNFSMVAGASGLPILLNVTWSLAIEEQFYLVWPWVVKHTSARALGACCALVLVSSPAVRYLLITSGVHPWNVYVWTFTRLDGIVTGVLVALAYGNIRRYPRRAVVVGGSLAATAIPIAFGWLVFEGSEYGVQSGSQSATWTYSLLAAGFGGLLVTTLASPAVARAFTPRWLCYVGTISYGLYIYHIPVIGLMHQTDPWIMQVTGLSVEWARAIRRAIIVPLYFGVAEMSYRYFETPILRLKSRFASPQSGPELPLTKAGVGPSV